MQGKRISEYFKTAVSVFTALSLLAGVCACGGRAGGGSAGRRFSAVARNYSVSRQEIDPEPFFCSALLPEGAFCCLNGKVSEDSDVQTLKKYSLTENRREGSVLPLSVPRGRSAGLFAPDKEGNILVMTEEASSGSFFLGKYTSDGEQLFDRDITPYVTGADGNAAIRTMLADADGIYLAVGSAVVVLKADGSFWAELDTEAGQVTALFEQDGGVYAAYGNKRRAATATKLARLDVAGKKLLPRKSFPPLWPELFCMSGENTLLFADRQSVYLYALDTGEYERIFDWLDCDITGSQVENIGVLRDGRIALLLRDWSRETSEIVLLAGAEEGEPPEKQVVTLGTVVGTVDLAGILEKAIADFNRSDSAYRLEIRNYNRNGDAADARDRLNLDIVSGKGPDLLVLDGLDVRELAAKGVFEDLSPYLEQSGALDREDFFESVLECSTYGGALIGLPTSFSLTLWAGKASELGGRTSWTLSDVLAYGKEHPDAALFRRTPRDLVLTGLLAFSGEDFFDPETGECHFDSGEFQDLLRLIAAYPDWNEYSDLNHEDPQSPLPLLIARGEVLLEEVHLDGLYGIQETEGHFGEAVNFIGCPNPYGEKCSLCSVSAGSYAISSRSQKKEGAWEFMEFLFSVQADYEINFPSRKSEFERYAGQICTGYRLDENGEPILNAAGEPYRYMTGGTTSWTANGETWSYTSHTPTEEEIALLLALIDTARPRDTVDDRILNIILEECGGLGSGDKSPEETAEVIRNRVRLYLQERQ